jgi:hypothetical protein
MPDNAFFHEWADMKAIADFNDVLLNPGFH